MSCRQPITAVEWSPREGSVLCTSCSDGTVGVWDLSVERDAEEEAALGATGMIASGYTFTNSVLGHQLRHPVHTSLLVLVVLDSEDILSTAVAAAEDAGMCRQCRGALRPATTTAVRSCGTDRHQGRALAPSNTWHADFHWGGRLQCLQTCKCNLMTDTATFLRLLSISAVCLRPPGRLESC